MKSECLETEIILCKRQSHRKVFRSQISLCCPSKIDEKCHRHEYTSKLLSAVGSKSRARGLYNILFLYIHTNI